MVIASFRKSLVLTLNEQVAWIGLLVVGLSPLHLFHEPNYQLWPVSINAIRQNIRSSSR
jgi:hypothetical protein